MARGDQIYVIRPFLGLSGVYEHHGIDCGDGTVIHYSKAEDVATIRRTPLSTFTLGHPIYVKAYPTGYIGDVAIQRAESRLGEQQYNLISNNCEHFATWCKTGVNRSQQVEDYGLGTDRISAFESGKLVREATETGERQRAIALFQQALQNIAVTERGLQVDYRQEQAEMQSWHRVAQTVLKQGKEAPARRALERWHQHKRRSNELKSQLDQLAIMRSDVLRNQATLKQQP